nr:MAG TPA: hypothetical protein [Caudoviricetes sp.]
MSIYAGQSLAVFAKTELEFELRPCFSAVVGGLRSLLCLTGGSTEVRNPENPQLNFQLSF